ncbi:unnamed protein product [Effrenium voratum]|uniref:Uncharacterized protein n=1 Tax=Effrenium voratum TaxID=2562239 RepID=A0AA36JA69_9DINO|nr:unnamed protein product [Effrenium voratum]
MRMVSLDWMHCFNLGVCRDETGSCLKILWKNRQYFEGSSLDNRELRAFLQREGLHMHLKYVKENTLIWKNDACPELLCSASDATAVLRFLSQKLAQKPSPFPFEGLSACMWVAEQLNATILRSNVFMTEPEVQAVDALGSSFLRMYLSLANKAQEQNALWFKLRPKFHFVQHLLLDATARPSRNDDTLCYDLAVVAITRRGSPEVAGAQGGKGSGAVGGDSELPLSPWGPVSVVFFGLSRRAFDYCRGLFMA